MDTENRYRAARMKFFAENPRALEVAETVDNKVIEACGVTVEEYREVKRCEAFAQAAEDQGLEVSEFVIRLAAESPEQAQLWRIEWHKRVADILGIEWNDYKKLNWIVE